MSVFLRTGIAAAIGIGLITATASVAHASAPLGVYARVDSVKYGPDKASATQFEIHGVFAVHQGGKGFDYSEPKAGYMHFACPAGKEAECLEQWKELEGYIGNKQECAGFGQWEKGFGTVHAEGTVAKPELYDLGMGVQSALSAGGTCPKLLGFTSSTPTPGSSGSSGAGSGNTSGGTPNPPGGGNGSGEGTSAPSEPSPPSAPSSSSDGGCSATPGTTGSSLAFAAVVGAVIGFLARRKRNEGDR